MDDKISERKKHHITCNRTKIKTQQFLPKTIQRIFLSYLYGLPGIQVKNTTAHTHTHAFIRLNYSSRKPHHHQPRQSKKNNFITFNWQHMHRKITRAKTN